jgi:peptidoglycan/LPS O-acetylase OafA/YrhL
MDNNVIKNTAFLDGLRGLASLYVMVGHARWLLWEGYETGFLKHPQDYNLFNKILVYFFSGFKFGHEAVLFFFVLSGFVIHLKYAKNLARSGKLNFIYTTYLIKRFKRIYPPFVISLLLTFILDSLGKRQGYSIYCGTTPYPLINLNIGNRDLGFTTFLGNLSFLYTTYFPIAGTNGPAWSLKFEWWFYMLYPLFLFFSKKNLLISTVFLCLLFLLSFYPAHWPELFLPEIFSMMLCWWLGVILAEVYVKRINIAFEKLSYFLLAFLFCVFKSLMPVVIFDLIIALGFIGLISFGFSLKGNNVLIAFLTKLKFLANFSYTLYIIHFPILVFISGWLMSINGNKLPSHFGYVFACILLISSASYIIHYITEVPFIKQRKNLIKH